MDDHPVADESDSDIPDTSSKGGRKKQKIRIKYRQRVKIKKRPRGYKFKRSWKKNRKNIFAFMILTFLLGATVYMVFQVAKQRIEMKQHQQNQRLKTR